MSLMDNVLLQTTRTGETVAVVARVPSCPVLTVRYI